MKSRPKYGHLIKWIFSIIDLIILNSSFFVSYLITQSESTFNIRLVLFLLNISYLVVIYFMHEIHDRRVLYADHVVLQAIKAIFIHGGLFLSIIEFTKIGINLNSVAYFYLIFSISLISWWLISRKIIKLYRNHGFNYRNIVIVGTGNSPQKFIDEITGDIGYGYRLLAIFGCNDQLYPQYKHLDNSKLEEFVTQNQVDELYCSLPKDEKLSEVFSIAEHNAIDFYYLPQLGQVVTRKFAMISFGNVPVMSIMPHPSQNILNRFIKRLFDIIVSICVLTLLPIIFIPIAIAIKINSRGPIFFVQKRTGYRGKEFNCYKFRTMYVNDDDESHQVFRDDPNVTKVGKFLRHYSIDELPQFLNVLKGDMSIAGPRPHMVQHTELYKQLIDKYMLRHLIKPGITGWAQVLGYRGNTNELWKMEKRVECDVWYAENWNFMLDIKIIILTIYKALKGDTDAY